MIRHKLHRGAVTAALLLATSLTTGAGPLRAEDRDALAEPAAGAEPLSEGVVIRELQAPAPPGTAVDESLLRYLAEKGDKTAVEAEIERLRELNPDWKPPTDLYEPRPVVNEGPLWELYEKRDFAELRKQIEVLRGNHPEWKPPQALLDLMETQEVRSAMEAAEAAKNWQGITDLAAQHPTQMNCANVDHLWRLGEANAKLGKPDAAREAYAAAIRDCADADLRLSTLQKAQATLGRPALDPLLELERTRPSTTAQAERLRQFDAAPVRAAKAVPRVPAVIRRLYAEDATVEDARAAMEQAERRRDAAAARQIGWLLHNAGESTEAASWMRRSLDWKRSRETAEALATVLAARGDSDGIDALAQDWPDVVLPFQEQARAAAVDRALAAEEWPTVLNRTQDSTAPTALLPRGWALLALSRPTEAMLAFERAVEAEDLPHARREEAVYGLVRSQIASNLFEDADRTVARYGLSRDKEFGIRAEFLARQAQVALDRSDWLTALQLLERRRDLAQPDRGLEIQEAWARYNLRDFYGARAIFERLDRLMVTPDSQAGLRAVDRAISAR